MENNVVNMPVPKQMSPEQIEHWEDRLAIAEHHVEVALRMLGRLPVKSEVPDGV